MKLDTGLSTRNLRDVPAAARAAEAAGFDAIWIPEAGNDGFLPGRADRRAYEANQDGYLGCDCVSAQPHDYRRDRVGSRGTFRGPLHPRTRHAGEGPYRAPLQHEVGSAGAAPARVSAVAARDFQMLVGGRREAFVPGQVLQLLADDAVLHARAAQLPQRADSHRGRERTISSGWRANCARACMRIRSTRPSTCASTCCRTSRRV